MFFDNGNPKAASLEGNQIDRTGGCLGLEIGFRDGVETKGEAGTQLSEVG
jgi:hypothetical protein